MTENIQGKNLISMLDVSSMIPTRQKQLKLKKKQAQKGKNHRAGDWVCLMCNNLNYSFRKICNRCGLQTKKQNLIQALMLLNEQKASIQNSKIESNLKTDETQQKPILKQDQENRVKRVPFGDITNQNENHIHGYSHFGNFSNKNFSKFGGEGNKAQISGERNGNIGSGVGFGGVLMTNLKFDSVRKIPMEGKERAMKGQEGGLCRGFNTAILLNEALKTPQKENEEEEEEYDSLNQIKAVSYILDSEKKQKKHPEISSFNTNNILDLNEKRTRLAISSLSFETPTIQNQLFESFKQIHIDDGKEIEEREDEGFDLKLGKKF